MGTDLAMFDVSCVTAVRDLAKFVVSCVTMGRDLAMFVVSYVTVGRDLAKFDVFCVTVGRDLAMFVVSCVTVGRDLAMFVVSCVGETIPQSTRALLYTESYRDSIATLAPSQVSVTLTGANASSAILSHLRHTET
jgi:hypothetical protein